MFEWQIQRLRQQTPDRLICFSVLGDLSDADLQFVAEPTRDEILRRPGNHFDRQFHELFLLRESAIRSGRHAAR